MRFDRAIVRILLSAGLVLTGGGGLNSTVVTANQSVGLPAAVVGGEVYVKANSLTNSLGGTGQYDPVNKTFYYSVANPVQDVIEKISPAVVAIIGKPNTGSSKPSDRFDLAHGTGVTIKSDGWIVTNAHVVNGMQSLVVVTSDGKQFVGKATNIDEASDLALVKINALDLPTAAFAANPDIHVGETVVAIGTPISFALRNSVTVGVVSGLNRAIDSTYKLIQTDTAINPGNSGGPLVNMKGEVIGVNSLKFVDVGVESLGFAIPSNTVQYIIKQFFQYGKVNRPYLGFETEESWAAVVGLPTDDPLTITSVAPASSAEVEGVSAGDILLSIDGISVSTTVEVNELLKQYLPGQKVKLSIKSGTEIVITEVELQKDPTNKESSVPIDLYSTDQPEIWMKLGKDISLVNGQTFAMEKPYVEQGTAMVPLRVFVKSYKANSTWNAGTKTAVYSKGTMKITITAGSNQALVDGKSVSLPTAPMMKNGTLMVPLRAMCDILGANLKFYAKTSEMIVTAVDGTNLTTSAGINGDEGKTQIGNSYYGWTMKYPSGLIKNSQNTSEAHVNFYDAKGEYQIDVSVVKKIGTTLSNDELMKKLSDTISETILDKGFVTNGNKSYANIKSKNGEGNYSEHRAYQNDKYIFYITFIAYKADSYKNATKYKGYQDLLNSFNMSFDVSNPLIKDISSIKNGVKEIADADHAITLKVPAGWISNYREDGVNLSYYNPDDPSQSIRFIVTSAVSEDTLDAWASRKQQKFTDEFMESYRKIGGIKSTTVDSLPARKNLLSDQLSGEWKSTEQLYIFKGKYKYQIEIGLPKDSTDAAADEFVNKIVNSITIGSMNSSFGIIPDDEDFINKTKLINRTSEKYNYSIDLPSMWKEGAGSGYLDEQSLYYTFTGGDFYVNVSASSTLESTVSQLESSFKDAGTDIVVLDKQDVTVFGVNAKRFMIEDHSAKDIQKGTLYIFSKNDLVYVSSLTITDAVSTPENVKRLNDAFQSFHFLK